MKIIIVLIFFISFEVLCNEAILEIAGGAVKPLYNSNTNVCMDSEIVIITLDPNTYTVNANFYFSNEGETEILAVGFPKYAYGYYEMNNFKGVEFFNFFTTYVNDIPVKFQEMISEVNLPGMNNLLKLGPGYNLQEFVDAKLLKNNNWFIETKWLVKNVIFKMFDNVMTEVNYKAKYATYGFYDGVEYLYGTGKTWKGNIKQARFIINFSPQVWPIINLDRRKFFGENYQLKRTSEFSVEIIVKDFEPQEKAILSFPVSDGEFSWDWDHDYYSKNLVSEDQLKIMSLKQLRLFRNSIYAKHGRSFNSADLNTYFNNEYWYHPNISYHDSLLNEIELENVTKIYNYELKLKNGNFFKKVKK